MPLLWLSTSFLIGIWLGCVTSLPKTILFTVFLLWSFLSILEKRLTQRIDLLQKWRKISPLPMAVLLAALALGAWRYPPAVPTGLPGTIASFNDLGERTLTALVTRLPEKTDRSTRFVADSIAITDPGESEQPLSGKIQVEVWAGTSINYGDMVRISGKSETPSENESFSYQDYLARKGVHSLISFPRLEVLSSGYGNPLLATLYRFRHKGYEVLNSILPQPQAALLSGILLGLDQDLPDDLVLAFQETGTAHIIAISGFNIAIISAFFFWLFRLLATLLLLDKNDRVAPLTEDWNKLDTLGILWNEALFNPRMIPGSLPGKRASCR
jgi:competence protein ComEC